MAELGCLLFYIAGEMNFDMAGVHAPGYEDEASSNKKCPKRMSLMHQ